MLQTSIVRKKLYHINNTDKRDYSQIVWERKEKLDKMILLIREGCAVEVALEALDVLRASYYRWKKNYKLF